MEKVQKVNYFVSEKLNLIDYIKFCGVSKIGRAINKIHIFENQSVEKLDSSINNLFEYYSTCEPNKNLLGALDKIIFNHINYVQCFDQKNHLLFSEIFYDVPIGLYNIIIEQSKAITPQLKEHKLAEEFKNSLKSSEMKLGF